MKVKELIAKLKELPPDMEVAVDHMYTGVGDDQIGVVSSIDIAPMDPGTPDIAWLELEGWDAEDLFPDPDLVN